MTQPWQERTLLLMGEEALQKLADSEVAVIGLGGVGAYAAEMLAVGKLPEGSAAVCRKDAGEHYGLFLANENVEDNPDNMTKFSLVKLE